MKIDLTDMPTLPMLAKPVRRKSCGACGTDIRKSRSSRSSGLCWTCTRSIEHRGRPSVPFADCKCSCQKHAKWMIIDDGQCGSPVGGGRHTDCCFEGEDKGDPEFRKLFLSYEQEYHRRVQAVHDFYRKQREERWARGEKFDKLLDG